MNSLIIGKFPPLEYGPDEAVNTLCTNLSFAGEKVKKIMITSCTASEGKSFLSMNVMRTMARLGKRVVLVDTDLRRSMIRSNYKLSFAQADRAPGLAHLLAGMCSISDVLYKTNIERAYMVPIGREVTNSLPLLNSPRFEQLLNELARNFDYVIVDAPPVGTIIDAAQIAKHCDGSLIVVSYNAVHRRQLIEVKEQLVQTGCPILGTVLNMVEYDSYMSRKYYYKSGYSKYGYGAYEYKKSQRDKPAKGVKA